MVYLLCFLSGVAALVYQVGWVRSLTLVFGGSHQAVTAVLAIFMAGLGLGGYLIGARADRVGRPLALYGLLELGIAASALGVMALMAVYPDAYAVAARGREGSIVYLAAIRTLFAVAALGVPTVLMGGTLPLLARCVARGPTSLSRPLAFLYGLNTLGAVAGALLAGFVLLRISSVSVTLDAAVAVNVLIGILSLSQSTARSAVPDEPSPTGAVTGGQARDRLVLWGIAISGFCALGYEVLWTRILTIGVGASVYGFTVMLVAFLVGIALGSKAYGLALARTGDLATGPRHAMVWFGLVQIVIGLTAFAATAALHDVPLNVVRLQAAVAPWVVPSFATRVWSAFALAFLYLAVPAFFLGVAFPLAAEIHARRRRAVGPAVGEVLAANTVGAILGAALSGFALIYLFGIETSLYMLHVLNVGTGLVILAGVRTSRRLSAIAAVATLASLVVLALKPEVLRIWDTKYFAIFRSNQPDAFATPAMLREAVDNTDVLYYAEGVESTVSVVRAKGGDQAFITNGRVESSTDLREQQCVLTLGHLPMLLAAHPRHVLVVGLGTGMTLGATAVHPGVERLTVVELEPKVMGVARAFAAENHGALDDPRLRMVFDDGRNFLLTTRERFDVITADPIHPWFRGAGYLYTTEYFRLAAARLNPGGVMAQWLPLYELTPADLRSIVRTFREHFRYTLLWLTHHDAELIGSNSPLLIDEGEIARRLAVPAVAGDLERIGMGSATDLLGYFVMGSEGMARFSHGAILNTDDRLYLEFSAPFSIASPAVMAANVAALATHRESILPYLAPAPAPAQREAQRRRWDAVHRAGTVRDRAQALFLAGRMDDPHFTSAMATLDHDYPGYAPGRFLRARHDALRALAPRPLRAEPFVVVTDQGVLATVEITAVLVPVSRTRAALVFVDNAARVVYGERYVDNYEESDTVARIVADTMIRARDVYEARARTTPVRLSVPPRATVVLPKIEAAIRASLAGQAPLR